jgi:peptidyl-prolyl cis-trans isomerase SurA
MNQTRATRYCSLAALAIATCVIGACGNKQNTAAAAKASSPDTWAVVDAREINRSEVEKAYKTTVQTAAAPLSDDEAMTLKLNIIDQLINQNILLARARALGVEATDAEVENSFAERKRPVADDAFQQQLTQQGLTVDDVKQGIRRELSVQKVLDREVASRINITDQDVTDFYGKNRAQFNLAETQYRLAQIVVTSARDPRLRNRKGDDAATAVEARQKLEMLMARLKEGADFAQLAMDYSEDPQSLANGGDLGFVPVSAINQVSPQLGSTVVKMEPGTISTVTLGSNYTILLLIAREPAGQRDLSRPDVRDGIRDTLKTRKEELLRTAYVTAARNDAKVVNYLAQQVLDAQAKQPPALVPTGAAKK